MHDQGTGQQMPAKQAGGSVHLWCRVRERYFVRERYSQRKRGVGNQLCHGPMLLVGAIRLIERTCRGPADFSHAACAAVGARSPHACAQGASRTCSFRLARHPFTSHPGAPPLLGIGRTLFAWYKNSPKWIIRSP